MARNRMAAKATKAKPVPKPRPTMEQRTFELVRATPFALTEKDLVNVTSAINRALHQEGISDVRVDRVRCTDTGRLFGVTSPTSTLQGLLQH